MRSEFYTSEVSLEFSRVPSDAEVILELEDLTPSVTSFLPAGYY